MGNAPSWGRRRCRHARYIAKSQERADELYTHTLLPPHRWEEWGQSFLFSTPSTLFSLLPKLLISSSSSFFPPFRSWNKGKTSKGNVERLPRVLDVGKTGQNQRFNYQVITSTRWEKREQAQSCTPTRAGERAPHIRLHTGKAFLFAIPLCTLLGIHCPFDLFPFFFYSSKASDRPDSGGEDSCFGGRS